MIRIAICDDEVLYLKKIERLIRADLKNRQVDFTIDCFESGKMFIEQFKKNLYYDIAFLDVNMEEIDGVETAKIIRTLSEKIYIVFITAYITYATDGYKVNAIRYLLKDKENLKNSIKECMDVIIQKMNYKEEKLEIEFQNRKVKLPLDRILYVESQLHKLIFYVLEDGIKEYYTYGKLDMIQKQLEHKGVCRIHQSYLVNMKYVKRIERYHAVLNEGTEISVSKRYYKDAEDAYISMRGEI